MSWRNRRAPVFLARMVLATVVPLALLEAALQLAALATAWRNTGPAACAGVVSDAAPILCLGDSYTFGIGASAPEHAWPRVLERTLAESGQPRRVVDSGWPSCNSREVLAALRRELPRVKPSRVVILVGVNDRWSRPELLEPARSARDRDDGSAGPGFQWRWRTRRLLQLLLQPRSREPPAPIHARGPERAHPLVGTWELQSQPDQLMAFRPDGVLLAGPARWRWSEADGRLRLVDADGVETWSSWRVDGDHLELQPQGGAAATFRRRTSVDAARADDFAHRVEARLAVDDDAGAGELVDAWLRAEPDSADAHLAQLRLAVRADRRGVVDLELDWLRRRRATAPDERVARALVHALGSAGRRDEALAVAREEVLRYPDAPRLWHLLAENARLAGDLATAERAVDRAIALAPGATQEDRAAERLLRANVVAERDPREAARELVRAFAIDGDPTLVRRYWLNHEREATVEKLAAAADEVGVDAATRAALLAAHPAAGAGAGSGTSAGATVAAGDPGVAAVLTRHLVAMVEECRAAGAEPFLVSYPYRVADVDAAREAAARETGAARVELVARFDELLRELPREALFVPDGHCNDRGYAEIAALVAAALQRPR